MADTIVVAGERVRLEGIDAPRPEEIVLDLDATDDPLHVPPPDRRFDLPA